jgi:hypothetical protein
MLREDGVDVEVSPVAPLGQKLAEIAVVVGRLTCVGAPEVLG